MEELILQNLGNISLAGALVLIAFILRPVLMLREENASKRDEREHELAKTRAEVDRQTATVLNSLKNSLEANQPIAKMQLDAMEQLAEKVREMTDDNNKGFGDLKDQIEALPDKVWETGDPKLSQMIAELKQHIGVAGRGKEDEILTLLRKILEQLEATTDKPKEANNVTK